MPIIEVKLGEAGELPTDETVKFLDSGLGPKPRSTSEMFLTWLVKMLDPKLAVEVGVLYGETTACLAAALRPGAVLYALDVDLSRAMPVLDAWGGLLGLRDRIIPIEGPSQEMLRGLPDGIEFAFVDGDHSVEGVLGDIDVLWPKMAPNGVMAFHDVNDEKIGVIQALPHRFGDTEGIYLPWHQGLFIVQKGPRTIVTRQQGLRVPWGTFRAPDTAQKRYDR